MGDAENVVITPRDMYEAIIGMRTDLQSVALKLDHVIDSSRDHETRLRAIEAEDYVTADDLNTALQGRSSRSLVIAATVAGLVSTLIATIDFLTAHHS